MTNEEYSEAQDQVLMVANLASNIDLEGFVSRIDAMPPDDPLLTVVSPYSFLETQRGVDRVAVLRMLAVKLMEVGGLRNELRALIIDQAASP